MILPVKKGSTVASKRAWISAAVLGVGLAATSCGRGNGARYLATIDDAHLARELEAIAGRRGVPAIAAALATAEGIKAKAVVGSTLFHGGAAVGATSMFHIGSTTKPVTAVLLAMLVAEGKLGWDTTLEEALPGIPMREEYRGITLHELLLSRAGIIAFQNTAKEDQSVVRRLWMEIPAAYPNPASQRRAVTEFALSLPPIATPGVKSIYSNVGWAIAGHIAERAAGQSYEELVTRRVFTPLGMHGSRIGGWPADHAGAEQPMGHFPPAARGAPPRPQTPQDGYELPAWVNPSGGIMCTIEDFALFAREQLQGIAGEGVLLDSAGYARIHSVQATARREEFYPGLGERGAVSLGYGWEMIRVEKGLVSAVDGTAGTFYARLAVYPSRGIAFAGFDNRWDGDAALDDAVSTLTGLRPGG